MKYLLVCFEEDASRDLEQEVMWNVIMHAKQVMLFIQIYVDDVKILIITTMISYYKDPDTGEKMQFQKPAQRKICLTTSCTPTLCFSAVILCYRTPERQEALSDFDLAIASLTLLYFISSVGPFTTLSKLSLLQSSSSSSNFA